MALDSTSLMAFNLFPRCARSALSPHAEQSSPAATEHNFPKGFCNVNCKSFFHIVFERRGEVVDRKMIEMRVKLCFHKGNPLDL